VAGRDDPGEHVLFARNGNIQQGTQRRLPKSGYSVMVVRRCASKMLCRRECSPFLCGGGGSSSAAMLR